MEIALNHQIREMELAETLKQVVSDALICMGILKMGVCYSPKEGTEGIIHDYGEPYADAVALDDWVMDMGVNRFDQVGYCGHHFRVPKEAMLQDPRYDPDQIRGIPHSARWGRDESGNDRLQSLSADFDTDEDADHEDMLDLWELWVPRDNMILVMASVRGRLMPEPLYVADYQGPEFGPYLLLRFNALSSNIMPAAPLLHLADMHEAMNGVARKLIDQGLRQKNITIVTGAQEEDITRYNKTPDGHAVRGDFGEVGETRLGGIDQQNAMFLTQLKSDSDYWAGNLSANAGLGPQSETLGQDRMIMASSSKMMQAMQEESIVFVRKAMRTLAWYWVNDKNKTYSAEVPIQGTDLKVPVQITPEDREGTWLELNFDIDPYSLQGDSPQSRMAMIDETMMKVVIPLMPVLAEQKLAPNIQGYLRLKGRYGNMPDMEDLVIFNEPSPDSQELREVPRMAAPANKTTTSVRINRPGATVQGKDMAMMQTMAGKPPQPAAQEAMMRPTG